MYVIRNLNLLGFFPDEDEERGSALEERAAAAGVDAPRREREPDTPSPFPWDASAFFPQFSGSNNGGLVGYLEKLLLSVIGKTNAGHLLNDMHNIWCIGKMLHRILGSIMDLVPYIAADGELLKLISKSLKHLL